MTIEPIVFRAQQLWTITRAGKSYSVRFEQVGNHFTGHYVDLDNPSHFSGDIVTGQGATLVQFMQVTEHNDYYAVHAGERTQAEQLEGHWYDTAGNAGLFTLTQQQSSIDIDTEAIARARQRAILTRIRQNLEAPNPALPDPSTVSVDDSLAKVQDCIAQQDYLAAIHLLHQAYKFFPQDSRVHSLLGRIFLQQQFGFLAKYFTDSAIALNPDDPQAQENRQELAALTQEQLEQMNPHSLSAIEHQYQRLLQHYPDLFGVLELDPLLLPAGVALIEPAGDRPSKTS